MGKYVLLVGVCLLVSSVTQPVHAQTAPASVTPLPAPPPAPDPAPLPRPARAPRVVAMLTPMHAPRPVAVVPSHLRIGAQQFDASVEGLRAYVDATATTDPSLHAALAPDVARLEERRNGAFTALAVGGAAAVVAEIYAFAGRSTCSLPDAGDPNFAAKSAAWNTCTEQNMQHLLIFSLAGMGAFAAGAITAAVMAPKRSDVLDVVNKHNRLNPEPLQLEVGYDPTHRYAFAGAGVVF